jgi:enoyl-CoA hydratase/carnithine racemase
MGSAYLLPRLIGLGRATELLLLGDDVSADRALEIGLASGVVVEAELPEAAAAVASRLAIGPSLAYSVTKTLLSREQDMSLSAALEVEAIAQALLLRGADHAEFYAAFREGRDPAWSGR